MQYVGIQSQISRNNLNSFLLLVAFPALLLAMYFLLIYFLTGRNSYPNYSPEENGFIQAPDFTHTFLKGLPFVLIGVGIWFLIAYAGHSAFIRMATGALPLERKENMRVYNLVENLCIQVGMPTPKIYIIDDDSLNAYASGIDKKTYSITLSKGIIEKLNDEELEGVIGHELTHIRNHDTRLLIISIIFVGIFAFLAQMALRSLRFTGGRKKDGGYIVLIAIAVTAVCYFISLFLRFGISRRREFMADAGSAELTKKPYALASALKKIDSDPLIEAVHNEDVAQLFIDNPQNKKKSFFSGLFDTHPPIEKRIQLLEQFV
ncbi:MAG: M48 family metallopeptidase [Bacteroidetes bacterium]|nr:M48 family metallopeptidase [Bacteroidota bacterium]MBS1932237.1 M48 family metallopeptidase [Bacteroidota bacterium]